MRKFIAVMLLWVWPPLLLSQQPGFFGQNFSSGPPPPSLGVTCGAANTATSITCTLTGVTAGSSLIIGLTGRTTSSPTSVTDSLGTTVDSGEGIISWNGTGYRAQVLYVANATAGNHVITSNFAASTLQYMAAAEFIGAATTSPIDAHSSLVIATTSAPYSCASLTTTQTNDTVVAWSSTTSSSIAVNPYTGYTLAVNSAAMNTMIYKAANFAASYTPQYTTTSTIPAVCIAVAVKHV